MLAAAAGWQNVYRGMAVLLVVWGLAFGLLARDAPVTAAPKGLAAMLRPWRAPLAWALALFYFLTFGGFVAFSIYLPTLLRDEFGLQTADAGFRTAGFVVLATLLRPAGGWLADRIGGARVLSGVFLGVLPFALLLTWPAMLPFTVGALGCAALLGLGNGAVFKLVPMYFPAETATVTGLVGAMGGLGGFFPPLLLGFFRDRVGAIWPGFVLLAAVSALLWWVNRRVFVPRQEALELALPPELNRTADRLRAGAWATFWTGVQRRPLPAGAPRHGSRPAHGHAPRRAARRPGGPRLHRRPHGGRCRPGTRPPRDASPACLRKPSRRPRIGSARPSAPCCFTPAASSTSRKASRTAWR